MNIFLHQDILQVKHNLKHIYLHHHSLYQHSLLRRNLDQGFEKYTALLGTLVVTNQLNKCRLIFLNNLYQIVTKSNSDLLFYPNHKKLARIKW